MRQQPITMSREIGTERRGRDSITLSRFRVALAFIGAAMLLASATATTRLYAQESARVSKAPKPKAEALWVISNGSRYTPSISVFQPAQQKKNGTVGSYGIWVGSAYGVWALTFDSNHDLWVGLCGEYGAGYLAELTTRGLRSLVGNGGAKFTTVITNPSATSPEYLSCPEAMQFDPAGNLWVATAPGDLVGKRNCLNIRAMS
jgi:hypothetical protein